MFKLGLSPGWVEIRICTFDRVCPCLATKGLFGIAKFVDVLRTVSSPARGHQAVYMLNDVNATITELIVFFMIYAWKRANMDADIIWLFLVGFSRHRDAIEEVDDLECVSW